MVVVVVVIVVVIIVVVVVAVVFPPSLPSLPSYYDTTPSLPTFSFLPPSPPSSPHHAEVNGKQHRIRQRANLHIPGYIVVIGSRVANGVIKAFNKLFFRLPCFIHSYQNIWLIANVNAI